jgi:hypothetical protein
MHIQGSLLTALVDRTVSAAPATFYAHLMPILQSLHQAKLPSYPYIGKLVECVTGHLEQVSPTLRPNRPPPAEERMHVIARLPLTHNCPTHIPPCPFM